MTIICPICSGLMSTGHHDHRDDLSGIDDGPPLGRQYRKPPAKPAEELREIRARAWATRRERYGDRGHR